MANTVEGHMQIPMDTVERDAALAAPCGAECRVRAPRHVEHDRDGLLCVGEQRFEQLLPVRG